jgi:hypothetical protein
LHEVQSYRHHTDGQDLPRSSYSPIQDAVYMRAVLHKLTPRKHLAMALRPPAPTFEIKNTSANTSDFRMIVGPVKAERTHPVWPKVRGNNLAKRMGLRYENRVHRQLAALVGMGVALSVEHTPWFTFKDTLGQGNCSPDFLIHLRDGPTVVVEVKLTWVEVAPHKLADLYLPVVKAALGTEVEPLIICRNLLPTSPSPRHTVREALASQHRLLHWAEVGALQW